MPDHNYQRLTFVKVFLPLVVALSKLQAGFVIGWTAVLPKVQQDNSTSFTVKDQDVTWLISSPGIVGMICTLAIGPLIEFFGPRRLLLLIYVPFTLFWLMEAFTPYLSLFYVGRIGLAILFTVLNPIIPLLISELSDPKIRGFCLVMEEISVALGILTMYIAAQWLHWRTSTLICTAPSIIFFICCMFLPESPYWLVKNGQPEKAEKSMFKLWTSKAAAKEELSTLSINIKNEAQTTIKEQLKQLGIDKNLRPVLFLVSIFMLREAGGEYIVFSYTVYIFQQSGVEIDVFTCTTLVGAVRVFFTITSSLLSDRVGRRPLMIVTSIVCATSAAVCGIFILIGVQGASWVPLASVLVYVASYGLGIGPIPWGLVGEMLPTPVRSVGGPICIFGYSLMIFIVSYIFPLLLSTVGLGFIFIFCSLFLVVLSLILLLFFPETKGKTLNELQDTFKKKPQQEQGAFTIYDPSNGGHYKTKF